MALRDAGLPPLPRTAWLAIDLDRLAANLAAVRSMLPPGVRLEPVVKADAYGHGAVGVASFLEETGADGLSVATLDEARELRAAGVTLPLLVLFSIAPELAVEAARLDVAITIADRVLLERTLDARAAAASGAAAGPPPQLVVHLEVETGLGRGGLDQSETPWAAAAIRDAPGIRLAGIWSHLAAAGQPERSGGQSRRFDAALADLLADEPLPMRHLAASGALLAGTAPSLDAVRIGLATYGLIPDGLNVPVAGAAAAAALAPVMSLHARPVRVADLPAGHGVSYGPSFETARASRIATLPIGYADGWSRILSNRAEALVRGLRVPLVGTVAMDAVMADVTDVPGAPVSVDDEFVLLGAQGADHIGAGDLAQARTTISYEVLTSMARRVARVYYRSAVPVGLRTLTEETYAWHSSSSGMGISATSKSTRS